MISLSELVPSKLMTVSLLRNVRAKSVFDAAAIGANDGDVDGVEVYFFVRTTEGVWVIAADGKKEGDEDGAGLGFFVGVLVGAGVGFFVGVLVRAGVGFLIGSIEGFFVGSAGLIIGPGAGNIGHI